MICLVSYFQEILSYFMCVLHISFHIWHIFFCSFVLILVFIKVLICSNHYRIVIYFMMPLVLFLIKWVSTFYFIIFIWYPWLSFITCVIISEVILLSHISTFMKFIKFKYYWLIIFPFFILVTIVKYIYCWA